MKDLLCWSVLLITTALLAPAAVADAIDLIDPPPGSEAASEQVTPPLSEQLTFVGWFWTMGGGNSVTGGLPSNMMPDASGCATPLALGDLTSIALGTLGLNGGNFSGLAGGAEPAFGGFPLNYVGSMSLMNAGGSISNAGAGPVPFNLPGFNNGGIVQGGGGGGSSAGAEDGDDAGNNDGTGNLGGNGNGNGNGDATTPISPIEMIHLHFFVLNLWPHFSGGGDFTPGGTDGLADSGAVTIPLPAPVWMGLAGLIGVALLRRRVL